MKIIRLVLCLVLPIMFGSGCRSTVEKSGFLSGTEKMQRGKFLQDWWTAGTISKHTLAKIYIEPVDVTRIKDCPEISAAYASNFLATTMSYQIRANTGFGVTDQPAAATAKLSLAITYMTPGSVSGRMIAGELGLGHGVAQVDGRLADADGNEIACFAERRNDSGSIGFEDLGGDAGDRLVRRILESISFSFAKELTNSVSP